MNKKMKEKKFRKAPTKAFLKYYVYKKSFEATTLKSNF